MKLKLPRGLIVDTQQVPDDFEEQVQKAFREYTSGTNPDYMYQDKLCFIDAMVGKAHARKDPDDEVMDEMVEQFRHEVGEYGEFPGEDEYFSIEFMYQCFRRGTEKAKLYLHYFSEDHYENEKVMAILARAIKAVMEYKDGEDGL